MLARYGVTPTAERLQRAEYLGSHVFQMQVSDLDSTESTDLLSSSGLGDPVYNAFGSSESFANIRGQANGKITGGQDGMKFTYNATEFGIILVIQSIMPDESYYQGLDRSLVRGLSTPNADRFDFFTPEFENLGYQPVLASDVFVPDDDANPSLKNVYDANKVFGYQPRYHDYKFMRHLLLETLHQMSLMLDLIPSICSVICHSSRTKTISPKWLLVILSINLVLMNVLTMTVSSRFQLHK